jgi:hypothetical protein
MERALERASVEFTDGFERRFGTLRIWNDTLNRTRTLLHLHGAIDWWRYQLPAGSGEREEIVARASPGHDPHHALGRHGELLDVPADPRPLILTGTFNKILSYPTSIYADQHVRFHQALRSADVLLTVGYGFGDKGINARVVSWLEQPRGRRTVVVHPHPEQLRRSARGAIRDKWARWTRRDRLATIAKPLDSSLTWEEIRRAIRGEPGA